MLLYIVLAYLMLFAALTNSVCLNNASFFFLFKYFLCQGYELSGEIALKNNHYYYYYYCNISSFQKDSQSTVKKFILNSASKSCDLDPIPSKLLIECLHSIVPSLNDIFNSSLASGIFPQCFTQLLSHLFSKRGILITTI